MPLPPSVVRRRVGDDGVLETVVRMHPPGVTPAPAPPPELAQPEPTPAPLERFRDQLGKSADLAIARQAGVSRHQVGDYRRSLGIAAYTGHFVAGGRIGGSSEVQAASKPAARTQAAKAANAEKTAPVSPVEPFRDILGAVPDEVVAQRAGVERTTVGDYRRRLGIAAYTGHRGQGAAARRSVGGSAPAVAASVPTVVEERVDAFRELQLRKGKLDAFVHLVGRESDTAVAKLAGVTAGGVRAYRHRHGIPTPPVAAEVAPAVEVRAPEGVAVAPTAPEPVVALPPVVAPAAAEPAAVPARRGPGRPSKVEAFRHLVGVLSDEEVAKLAGTAPKRVELFRQRHGIALSGRSESREVGAATVVAEMTPLAAAAERAGAPPVASLGAAAAAPVWATVAATEVEAVGDARAAEETGESAPVEATPAPVVESEGRRAPPFGVVPAPEPPTSVPVAPLQAFRVVAEAKGERRRFVVVGENIGGAAAAALRSLGDRSDGPWTIRSVAALYEFLG